MPVIATITYYLYLHGHDAFVSFLFYWWKYIIMLSDIAVWVWYHQNSHWNTKYWMSSCYCSMSIWVLSEYINEDVWVFEDYTKQNGILSPYIKVFYIYCHINKVSEEAHMLIWMLNHWHLHINYGGSCQQKVIHISSNLT